MQFSHSDAIWQAFPELRAGALHAGGIHADADVEAAIADFNAIAEARLTQAQEGEFPEIRAWRRGFSRMGLKPTQYRCASEALLRRFRQNMRCRACIRSSISAMRFHLPSPFRSPFLTLKGSLAISKSGEPKVTRPI